MARVTTPQRLFKMYNAGFHAGTIERINASQTGSLRTGEYVNASRASVRAWCFVLKAAGMLWWTDTEREERHALREAFWAGFYDGWNSFRNRGYTFAPFGNKEG